jgi:hypothetical protein
MKNESKITTLSFLLNTYLQSSKFFKPFVTISEYVHAISYSLLSVKSVQPTAPENLSSYCSW